MPPLPAGAPEEEEPPSPASVQSDDGAVIDQGDGGGGGRGAVVPSSMVPAGGVDAAMRASAVMRRGRGGGGGSPAHEAAVAGGAAAATGPAGSAAAVRRGAAEGEEASTLMMDSSGALGSAGGVEALIWHASDTAVKPIVANRRIERLPEPRYEAKALPFPAMSLQVRGEGRGGSRGPALRRYFPYGASVLHCDFRAAVFPSPRMAYARHLLVPDPPLLRRTCCAPTTRTWRPSSHTSTAPSPRPPPSRTRSTC